MGASAFASGASVGSLSQLLSLLGRAEAAEGRYLAAARRFHRALRTAEKAARQEARSESRAAAPRFSRKLFWLWVNTNGTILG